MLPQSYKFHVVNNLGIEITGATDAVTINTRGWKFNSSGSLLFGSEVAAFAQTGVLADTATEAGSAQDNSTDLNLGLHATASGTISAASPDGSLDFYVEFSTDGGSSFPSDAPGFDLEQDLIFVGSAMFDGTPESHSINFTL